MLSYDPRPTPNAATEIITIGLVFPPSPLLAVYYDFETTKIFTRKVIGLSVRDHIDRKANVTTQVRLYPVVFIDDTGEMVEEDGSTFGYLGVTEEAEPKASHWNDKVRDLKKRMKTKPTE